MNLTIRHPSYYLGYNPEDISGKPFILVVQTTSGRTVKNLYFNNKETAVVFTQKNAESITVKRG